MIPKLPRCLAPIALAAVFAGGLTAQDAPPMAPAARPTGEALPAPHLRLTALGPQGWRVKLGPTNLGTLLDGDAARALWGPYVGDFGEQVATALDDRAEAARQRFFDYQGAIHVDIWFADFASGDGMRALSLIAEGDGQTDMTQLAADLAQLQKVAPGEWVDALVAGERMRTSTKNGATMCEARVVNGCLVAAITRSATEPLDALYAAAAARAAQPAADRTAAAKRPPLVVEAAPPLVFARLLGVRAVDEELLDRLGLDGVQGVTTTVSAAGPSVQIEAAVRFAGAPMGLMAALMPTRAALPRLARALPAAAPTFRLGHFGFRAMWDALVDVATADERQSPAEFTAEVKADVGVDLGADFFHLLGDEVLVTTQPVDDPGRPAKATWAMAIALDDGPAFQRSLAALVEGLKPHLTRQETATIAGVACNRYGNVLAYSLWLGASGRAFYLAGGSDAEGELAQLVAAVEAPMATAAATPASTPALDAALVGLQRALPAGHSGAARYDLLHGSLVYDALFLGFGGMLLGNLLGSGRDVDQEAIAEAKEAWLERLRAHDLATVRTATGFADGTWRFRLYW